MSEYKGIEFLRNKLAQKRGRIDLRYRFYEMKHFAKDMEISTPPKLRGWMSSFGWCGKAVDSLADRLVLRGFENDTYGMSDIYLMNNLDVLADSAVLGALICACSFIYISQDDSGFPQMRAVDGRDATGIIDPITNMLTEGYAVLESDKMTGRPKTEVYLQLIEKVLEKGKNAMVLVPEISLTPQIIDRFIARFDEPIAVLHSKLSDGERLDEWTKIKEGRARIVIGARSAIFAPMENLGILIIDEAHDGSYKSDMQPRYNAKDLAKYIASENNIPLVLGSATPDIVDYYKAQNGDINLITLTKRANNSKLPEVKIVDMRQEIAIGRAKGIVAILIAAESAVSITFSIMTITRLFL